MNLAGLIKGYKNKLFPFLQINKYKYCTSVNISSNLNNVLKNTENNSVKLSEELVEMK